MTDKNGQNGQVRKKNYLLNHWLKHLQGHLRRNNINQPIQSKIKNGNQMEADHVLNVVHDSIRERNALQGQEAASIAG